VGTQHNLSILSLALYSLICPTIPLNWTSVDKHNPPLRHSLTYIARYPMTFVYFETINTPDPITPSGTNLSLVKTISHLAFNWSTFWVVVFHWTIWLVTELTRSNYQWMIVIKFLLKIATNTDSSTSSQSTVAAGFAADIQTAILRWVYTLAGHLNG